MPRADEIGLNGGVLIFGAGVTFLTGLLFGLAPALRGGGFVLGSGGRTTAHNRTARMLVTVEVALSWFCLQMPAC